MTTSTSSIASSIINSIPSAVNRTFFSIDWVDNIRLKDMNSMACSIFHTMGIDLYDRDDRVLDFDEDGSWPTWAGNILMQDIGSWDHSSREPEAPEGVECFTYGSPCVGYKATLRAECLPDALVEQVHNQLFKELPCLIQALNEHREMERKAFGRRMNEELRQAGCSPAAIQAWWHLGWKREVSPTEWASTVQWVSDKHTELRLALSAHAGYALDRLGFTLYNRSFPRRMDIIHGLARVYNVKPATKAEYHAWLKGSVDVLPTSQASDGSNVWSF